MRLWGAGGLVRVGVGRKLCLFVPRLVDGSP